MANILVTGGAGFIGSNFVQYWSKHYSGDHITVLDRLTYAANLSNIANVKNMTFVQGDIRDYSLVLDLLRGEQIQSIVNFAAETHVDRSIDDSFPFVHTNIVGTHVLLEAARDAWVTKVKKKIDHRFHHVSTDEVFGSLEYGEGSATEESVYKPNSPYSASKAASDHLVRAYHKTYGLNTTTSHCSNNYGPYQHTEKLIPKAITNILNGRKIPVYGNGKNVRDWLYVEDHCKAIDIILQRGEIGETYNIGGGYECSNNHLLTLLCDIADVDTFDFLDYVTDRPGHDFRYSIDCSKLETLGYKPSVTLWEGLQATYDWYTGK